MSFNFPLPPVVSGGGAAAEKSVARTFGFARAVGAGAEMKDCGLATGFELGRGHGELGRRIAGCRGRLRRSRATRKIGGRATVPPHAGGADPSAAADSRVPRGRGETFARALSSGTLREETEDGVLVGCGAEKETNT